MLQPAVRSMVEMKETALEKCLEHSKFSAQWSQSHVCTFLYTPWHLVLSWPRGPSVSSMLNWPEIFRIVSKPLFPRQPLAPEIIPPPGVLLKQHPNISYAWSVSYPSSATSPSLGSNHHLAGPMTNQSGFVLSEVLDTQSSHMKLFSCDPQGCEKSKDWLYFSSGISSGAGRWYPLHRSWNSLGNTKHFRRHRFWAMDLTFPADVECTSESPVARLLNPIPRVSDSAGLGNSTRICISNKFLTSF